MDARIAGIGSIALRMALGYAAFGCVWILGSDHVVAMLFQDPASLTIVQSWKGLFFVLLSSVLIFAMGAFFMRALAASEFRYRSLFADSPEALVIYDLDTLLIVDANAAVGRLLGYDSAGMAGHPVSDFMPQLTTDALTRSLPRLRELSQSTAVWRLRHQDGRELDVSIHGQTYLEKGHRLRQVLLIDITARIRAETELLRALDELASTNERMRELGHAISHDLQEPLRQITSFVQLLERRYADRLDAEATQFIGYAVEGVARLKTLLADVEDFTVHSGPQLESVAANAVVETTLNDLGRSIDGAHAQVAVATLPRVQADPRRLAVVFHTVLDNAVKFRRPDVPCEIVISASDEGRGWVFRVQDNGIGIEPEFRTTVFSLFRRLHTRDRIPGNGTGLALAKKMVESWGGRIWVEAAPGGGSVFAFTVPGAADRD
ncbi:MAG: Bacteriophytochrome [Rhodospirillaceae bacterium]|nr:MAG: Bacteriophytochrome [Rhodospirillaceae bacterium]TNC93968.1 MAG: Bacteriophytochrome (Light-regulated signal transduction histidine kinase) [Stygiobacter sp.]